MIALFRKLRVKLIREGNAGRYMLYATGEILLVVGILIALQVNNWNEMNKQEAELANFLTKKLKNLESDRQQLQLLYDYRSDASEQCTRLLDMGLENAPEDQIMDVFLNIVFERRFVSKIDVPENQVITSYYQMLTGTPIKDLENEYLNGIRIYTFDEQRLNLFSENVETDLWRQGFFNDNRLIVRSRLKQVPAGASNTLIPSLVLSDKNGMKSMNAMIYWHESGNMSLSLQISNLLRMNSELALAIEGYLSKS